MIFEELLTSDFVKQTQNAAKSYIRSKTATSSSEQLNKTIHDYCLSNSIILSDMKKLLNIAEEDAFYTYEIYCENPYKHAIMLANKIHQNVGKWVRMETKITHMEFVIQYDFRDIVRIYNLTGMIGKKHIKAELYVTPIILEKMQYLPPEVELIDIYHRLYLPNNVEEWKDILIYETKLYQMVDKRTIHQITEGGGAYPSTNKKKSDLCKYGTCKHQRHVDIGFLRLMIFQHFIKTDFVLVGGWAKVVVAGEYNGVPPVREKLQIVSQNSTEDDIKSLRIFLKQYTNFEISYHEHNMHIPKDFRIRRITVRIHYPVAIGTVKEKPLLDIFNAASYELIPYKQMNIELSAQGGLPSTISSNFANVNTTGSSNRSREALDLSVSGGTRGVASIPRLQLKIGNIYVLLRFAMIDLLTIKMIGHLGKITSQVQAKHNEYILDIIHAIKLPKYEWLTKTAFIIDYYGIDINYNISKKLEDIKKENVHKPYIPELAMKQNAYRIIY